MGEQLTAEQQAALAAELAELEGPKRDGGGSGHRSARAHGDLSENFEYHAAKNEQGLLERRIAILRSRLDSAEIVDDARRLGRRLEVGSRVTIEDERRRPARDRDLQPRRRGRGVVVVSARSRAPRQARRGVRRDAGPARLLDGDRRRDQIGGWRAASRSPSRRAVAAGGQPPSHASARQAATGPRWGAVRTVSGSVCASSATRSYTSTTPSSSRREALSVGSSVNGSGEVTG